MQKRAFFTGIVQGVGFRPYVYKIAKQFGLHGFVRNTGKGVEAVFCGDEAQVDTAIATIRDHPPGQGRVDNVEVETGDFGQFNDFQILETPKDAPSMVMVPPDIGICDDCRRELLDQGDRRFGHALISCTNCGPRLTVIKSLPYDRHTITQGDFPMCPKCESEYKNPESRRHHAQTIACNDCGPVYTLGNLAGREALNKARSLLESGEVVAIKGIGGFHLACLAISGSAVQKVRQIKRRGNEPMAVMAFDANQAKSFANLDDCEEKLLTGWQKPIVLLEKSEKYNLSEFVAPNTRKIGVFLPYTPLHILLCDGLAPIVLTSANLHEEPIETDPSEKLLTPHILTNNREISVPIDDSVARCINGSSQLVRRARGFVPGTLPLETPNPVLALGCQMKNTFTFAWDGKALTSHHIGEMGNAKTFERFRDSLELFRKLFGFEEKFCAHDLHPSYTTTLHKHELSKAPNFIPVQHHHAHIASVMGEHGIDGKVLGLAIDGTGYGTDGTIWGCELMVADRSGFARVGTLRPFPLPGGESAIHDCRRIAYSLTKLSDSGQKLRYDKTFTDILDIQIDKNLNAPQTSSLGRLFDGFSAIAGFGPGATYEAELAVALESAFDPRHPELPFDVSKVNGMFEIGWTNAVKMAIENPAQIPGGFHKGIAKALIQMVLLASKETGINDICVSGGCMLNGILAKFIIEGLECEGKRVFINRQLPPTDGCVSFGQAVIACTISGGL